MGEMRCFEFLKAQNYVYMHLRASVVAAVILLVSRNTREVHGR
jgi:hypothetical protein